MGSERLMFWLAQLIVELLNAYTWIVIAGAIMSWLVAFGVVNVRNQFIRTVVNFLYAITEPVLKPIRRVLPNLGGVDISPVVLLIGIYVVISVIRENLYPLLLR
jgi:YggT family protein